MADQVIWLNSALCPATHAGIDPADRGFTLGDGIFETLRIAGGAPRHVALHLARLRQGAAALGLTVPLTDTQFQTAISTLLTANALSDATLRITLTRGTGPRGLLPPANSNPTLLITTAPFIAAAPEISAVICQTTRRNEFSPLSRIKSLNYLDSIIARREAAARGAEDAILLNTKGDAAEASAANLFVLQGATWTTPPVADGALPGILRARLLARNLAREMRITPQNLLTAACVCLGNTLSLRMLTMLDGKQISTDPTAAQALRTVLESPDT
ncbi:2-keto-4-methylthiobutyrate aminotransferase [Acidocella aquatica]|uniref:Probable branched-chain-amino-acid aminotransferase n=1 Tax=Acidocella aquatica TaxID=1922313 RepID=A0ABQ6ADK5_9PROT|nr:aminotransferase class IV [Acidocella aquatica]GLR68866.1 2-keto-4-methylthiobutyrate aminotransferase [Acidocella aquatica]